jgi:hypothetical protein
MAKAYNGKEISVLRFSRYAKELFPHKLDLRRIFKEWSDLGVRKPLLLGAGTEGEAWKISDDLVFKVHRTKGKYDNIVTLPASPHIGRLRPRIFCSGSFNPNLFWVIMERFDTFKEYDLELEILISEVTFYTEKVLKSFQDKIAAANNGHSILSIVDEAYPLVRNEIDRDSDVPGEVLLRVGLRYQLNRLWWREFIRQIIYLHLIDHADDLWLPNLGISRLGPKSGLFIFFDW